MEISLACAAAAWEAERGDAYLPDKCSNKHQHTASAMCWLWYWSLSTPNSLCVNYKHKTCTLSGGNRLTAAAKAPLLSCAQSAIVTHAVFRDKNKQVLRRSSSFNAVCSPVSCDGIPVLWHNPGCTRAAMRVFICACVSVPRWCWQHRWEADIIHRSVLTCPHLTKRPFFIRHEGKMGFYKPRIIWGPQRRN